MTNSTKLVEDIDSKQDSRKSKEVEEESRCQDVMINEFQMVEERTREKFEEEIEDQQEEMANSEDEDELTRKIEDFIKKMKGQLSMES